MPSLRIFPFPCFQLDDVTLFVCTEHYINSLVYHFIFMQTILFRKMLPEIRILNRTKFAKKRGETRKTIATFAFAIVATNVISSKSEEKNNNKTHTQFVASAKRWYWGNRLTQKKKSNSKSNEKRERKKMLDINRLVVFWALATEASIHSTNERERKTNPSLHT